MQIDLIKIRFQLIKWSVFLFGLSLPFAAWFIASDYFLLSRLNTLWVTLGATTATSGIFHLTVKYFDDGFLRSYADGGTWDYLEARFAVESRPTDIKAGDIWSGWGRLDREDVVFDTEAGISNSGIYINVNALGRILIPWQSITVLKRHRFATDNGWHQMVSIVLVGPDIDLSIPWQSHLDEFVPKSIGTS